MKFKSYLKVCQISSIFYYFGSILIMKLNFMINLFENNFYKNNLKINFLIKAELFWTKF
jgi:hypothetical protein